MSDGSSKGHRRLGSRGAGLDVRLAGGRSRSPLRRTDRLGSGCVRWIDPWFTMTLVPRGRIPAHRWPRRRPFRVISSTPSPISGSPRGRTRGIRSGSTPVRDPSPTSGGRTLTRRPQHRLRSHRRSRDGCLRRSLNTSSLGFASPSRCRGPAWSSPSGLRHVASDPSIMPVFGERHDAGGDARRSPSQPPVVSSSCLSPAPPARAGPTAPRGDVRGHVAGRHGGRRVAFDGPWRWPAHRAQSPVSIGLHEPRTPGGGVFEPSAVIDTSSAGRGRVARAGRGSRV